MDIQVKKEMSISRPLSSFPKIIKALREYGKAYVNVGSYEGDKLEAHLYWVLEKLQSDINIDSSGDEKIYLIGYSDIHPLNENKIMIYGLLKPGFKNKEYRSLLKKEGDLQ